MILLTAPLAFGALAFGTPLVRLLFERGAFDAASTRGVAAILACFSMEVVFTGYVLVLSGVLYARRRFGLLAGLSLVAILLNAGLDALLMRILAARGLALATTLVALALALSLGPFVRREIGSSIHDRSDRSYLAKVLASAAAMALLVHGWSLAIERWVDTSGLGGRLFEVGGGLGLGALAYFALVRMAGIEEAQTLLRRSLAPFWPSLRRPADPSRS
jgi:putative peptidoglycan lipid II flippase